MSLLDYFNNSGFKLIKKTTSNVFDNFEYQYEKNDVIFYRVRDRFEIFLDLKNKKGKERINLQLLYNSDELFSEEKILFLLSNEEEKIISRIKTMNDEEILKIKKASVEQYLGIKLSD